jgi:hypothetical protein
MGPISPWALLLLLLLAACSQKVAQEDSQARTEKAMEASGTVLDLIPRLSERLPFRQEKIGRILGVTRLRDEAASNAAFDVYKSTGKKGEVLSVEVRQRTGGRTDEGGDRHPRLGRRGLRDPGAGHGAFRRAPRRPDPAVGARAAGRAGLPLVQAALGQAAPGLLAERARVPDYHRVDAIGS